MTDTTTDQDFFDTADDANVVEMRQVTKRFGDTLVFENIDLDVARGEVVAVMRDLANEGIAEQGTPAEFLDSPKTDRAKEFLASIDED